jgi:hypothetical protein
VDKEIQFNQKKIKKETDEDKYFCYWNELRPGIFVPE